MTFHSTIIVLLAFFTSQTLGLRLTSYANIDKQISTCDIRTLIPDSQSSYTFFLPGMMFSGSKGTLDSILALIPRIPVRKAWRLIIGLWHDNGNDSFTLKKTLVDQQVSVAGLLKLNFSGIFLTNGDQFGLTFTDSSTVCVDDAPTPFSFSFVQKTGSDAVEGETLSAEHTSAPYIFALAADITPELSLMQDSLVDAANGAIATSSARLPEASIDLTHTTLQQVNATTERSDGTHNATTCYDCSGDSVRNDCEFNVASNGRPVVCIRGESCATRRVSYVSSGVVFSFQRGCKSLIIPDGETSNTCDSGSAIFQTCSSICDGNMCNDDSGVPVATYQTRRSESGRQTTSASWLSTGANAWAAKTQKSEGSHQATSASWLSIGVRAWVLETQNNGGSRQATLASWFSICATALAVRLRLV